MVYQNKVGYGIPVTTYAILQSSKLIRGAVKKNNLKIPLPANHETNTLRSFSMYII
ncbi:hypothetical protein QJS10_CPA03g01478 [Acorus calamus]|uniref:Uncharacterized protein n=1 Tax=Acorus calamus TaxID=4465 RepID=A0AAV9F635_ACOCL|nr:hypothetical protein QJS10_CPA03g01478 [Acorus calamus]